MVSALAQFIIRFIFVDVFPIHVFNGPTHVSNALL